MSRRVRREGGRGGCSTDPPLSQALYIGNEGFGTIAMLNALSVASILGTYVLFSIFVFISAVRGKKLLGSIGEQGEAVASPRFASHRPPPPPRSDYYQLVLKTRAAKWCEGRGILCEATRPLPALSPSPHSYRFIVGFQKVRRACARTHRRPTRAHAPPPPSPPARHTLTHASSRRSSSR